MALTAKRVARHRKKPGRYADGGGLYLQVIAPPAASWIFRYERGGRERMMGLGSVDTWSLAEARLRARAARQQLADGIDPLEAKSSALAAAMATAAKAKTFEAAAREYFHDHQKQWRSANTGTSLSTP